MDNNDDQLRYQNNSILNSFSASPTQLHNQHGISNSSSRESSPENNNIKVASRDSSPGLTYREENKIENNLFNET